MGQASVIRDYEAAYKRKIPTLREVRAVANLARQWHGHVPLAVASNGARENVIASLAAIGLLESFSTVVSIEDVRRGKPAADIYLEAARRLDVASTQCLVLEDSDEGIAAAKSAGMQVIDVRMRSQSCAGGRMARVAEYENHNQVPARCDGLCRLKIAGQLVQHRISVGAN